MANRNLLHRSKLAEFMLWLTENGHDYVEKPAMHQVISWKAESGPKPIIFDGKSSEHFSCNEASVPFVCDFINKPKKLKLSNVKFSSLTEHARFLGKIDDSMLGAIDNYFKHGLPAGSCTTKLIAGEYMEAWFCAHILIQPHDTWLWYYELGKAIQAYKENYA